jgi:hypothetical protein
MPVAGQRTVFQTYDADGSCTRVLTLVGVSLALDSPMQVVIDGAPYVVVGRRTVQVDMAPVENPIASAVFDSMNATTAHITTVITVMPEPAVPGGPVRINSNHNLEETP